MVCVSCVFHTTGGNPPGGTGAWRMSLRNRPEPAQIRCMSVARAGSRLSEKARSAGRLDALEPPLLRADGYPLTRTARAGPVPGPGLLVCVHHANADCCAILSVTVSTSWVAWRTGCSPTARACPHRSSGTWAWCRSTATISRSGRCITRSSLGAFPSTASGFGCWDLGDTNSLRLHRRASLVLGFRPDVPGSLASGLVQRTPQ